MKFNPDSAALWFEDLQRYTHTLPLHIRILILIAAVFILLIVLLIGIIISSRVYKTKQHLYKTYIQKKYQPILTSILFDDDERLLSPDLVKLFDPKDLYKQPFRNFILEELQLLRQNFRGETGERIDLLYRKLSFDKDSLKKLKHFRWYVKAKGMRELAMMNIVEAYQHITPLIHNRSGILRMEARIALMKLSTNDHLAFLGQESQPLTEWDKANIYSMLSTMSDVELPDFSRWLHASNETVVTFCISMIGVFKQKQSIPSLIQLMQNGSDASKIEIIKVLKVLQAKEAEPALVAMYATSNGEVQSQIIDALEVLASAKSISFLKSILITLKKDYRKGIVAIRTLQKLGNEGLSAINEIAAMPSENFELLLAHANDQRI